MENTYRWRQSPGSPPMTYGFDIIGIKHIVPWRHIALPIGHGIDKTCVGVARKVPQIDRPLRIAHTCAVAGRTVVREERRAFSDLLWSKLWLTVLRCGAVAHERETEACG